MNPAKRTLARTVKFASDHRVAIAVVTTAAVTAVVVKKTMNNMHKSALDFMAENGILDEFFQTYEDKI